MIISRTPYRLSFFGGGTDYPGWFREHGGAVLATTIDKFCYLTCRYLPPFFRHRLRVVYSKIEEVNSVDEVSHAAVREALRFFNIHRGVEIHHDGDIPARSGIGSSSSFTVGLLHALHALEGRMVSKQRLAMEGIHLEQEVLKETVGSQDQVMAAYGGLNHVLFHPNGEIDVRPLIIPAERKALLNSHLMLYFTGINRTAAGVAASYTSRFNECASKVQSISELVDQGIQILTSSDDLSAFGELLHEAWALKSSLSRAVTNSTIDAIYDDARSAGAIGGKLLGAGGGGFLLLFVPPEQQPAVSERLDGLIRVPFQFENAGSQIIFYDAETDYSREDQARIQKQAPTFRELLEGTDVRATTSD